MKSEKSEIIKINKLIYLFKLFNFISNINFIIFSGLGKFIFSIKKITTIIKIKPKLI